MEVEALAIDGAYLLNGTANRDQQGQIHAGSLGMPPYFPPPAWMFALLMLRYRETGRRGQSEDCTFSFRHMPRSKSFAVRSGASLWTSSSIAGIRPPRSAPG